MLKIFILNYSNVDLATSLGDSLFKIWPFQFHYINNIVFIWRWKSHGNITLPEQVFLFEVRAGRTTIKYLGSASRNKKPIISMNLRFVKVNQFIIHGEQLSTFNSCLIIYYNLWAHVYYDLFTEYLETSETPSERF